MAPEAGGSLGRWQTTVNTLIRTSPATATAAAWGMGARPSLGLVVTAAAMTILINIVVPVSRALGRGWEYRIDTRMGTPPIAGGQIEAGTPDQPVERPTDGG